MNKTLTKNLLDTVSTIGRDIKSLYRLAQNNLIYNPHIEIANRFSNYNRSLIRNSNGQEGNENFAYFTALRGEVDVPNPRVHTSMVYNKTAPVVFPDHKIHFHRDTRYKVSFYAKNIKSNPNSKQKFKIVFYDSIQANIYNQYIGTDVIKLLQPFYYNRPNTPFNVDPKYRHIMNNAVTNARNEGKYVYVMDKEYSDPNGLYIEGYTRNILITLDPKTSNWDGYKITSGYSKYLKRDIPITEEMYVTISGDSELDITNQVMKGQQKFPDTWTKVEFTIDPNTFPKGAFFFNFKYYPEAGTGEHSTIETRFADFIVFPDIS